MKALFTIKPLEAQISKIDWNKCVFYVEHTHAEITTSQYGAFKAILIRDSDDEPTGFFDSGAVSMCGSRVFLSKDLKIQNVDFLNALYGAMIGISFSMSHYLNKDGNKSYLVEDYCNSDYDEFYSDNAYNNYTYPTAESFGQEFTVFDDLTAKTVCGATLNNDAIKSAHWW